MSTNTKIMPWVQAAAAMIVLLLFCALAVGPMFGLPAGDPTLVETEKAVVLILVGFLFGTSVSGSKKDDTIAAMSKPEPPRP